jgi:hypothetical protein
MTSTYLSFQHSFSTNYLGSDKGSYNWRCQLQIQ